MCVQELTILGLVSLTLFVLETVASSVLRHDSVVYIEIVHMTLFVVTVMYGGKPSNCMVFPFLSAR